jgi:hypothetical protein
MSRVRQWALGLALATILVAVAVPVAMSMWTNRHFTREYARWRNGQVEQIALDQGFYDSFMQDKQRDDLVRGLTVEQLRKRFGDLRHGESATESQRSQESHGNFRGWDHYWIKDSVWVILVKEGKGERIEILKG